MRIHGSIKRLAAAGLALTLPATVATVAYGQTGGIFTWSVQVNAPQWSKALGVTTTRQGCSDPPASCMHFVGNVAQANNVRVFLSVPLNSSTSADDALQYSQLSLSAPFLIEVGTDDFVDQYRALFSDASVQPAMLLSTVITNLRSANPNLKYGATVYEDELTNEYLQDARLPAAIRSQFDYVHLFIHYRLDGPNFASYVQQAKQLFPNARIFAGSYAYDRRAFLPCSPSGQPCTAAQDMDLFKNSLALQAGLLRSGAVDSIEFFPGYFGAEETWTGWSNPRECAPGDVAACISNTKAMRLAAYDMLVNRSVSQAQVLNAASYGGGPVAPGETVALFGTGLGPPDGASLQLASPGFVSTSLGGTRVLFDGVPAPMLYAQANQANAIVPYEVTNQASTQLRVEYAGATSNAVTLPVAGSAPALFTADASGTGRGAILNQDLSLNSPANPALPGSIVVLYGTGAGQTTPGGIDGKIAADGDPNPPKPVLPVSVAIGGLPADVTYAGAAPELVAGVLQINARVSSAVAPGDSLPVEIKVGNTASQTGVTLAVRGAGPSNWWPDPTTHRGLSLWVSYSSQYDTLWSNHALVDQEVDAIARQGFEVVFLSISSSSASPELQKLSNRNDPFTLDVQYALNRLAARNLAGCASILSDNFSGSAGQMARYVQVDNLLSFNRARAAGDAGFHCVATDLEMTGVSRTTAVYDLWKQFHANLRDRIAKSGGGLRLLAWMQGPDFLMSQMGDPADRAQLMSREGITQDAADPALYDGALRYFITQSGVPIFDAVIPMWYFTPSASYYSRLDHNLRELANLGLPGLYLIAGVMVRNDSAGVCCPGCVAGSADYASRLAYNIKARIQYPSFIGTGVFLWPMQSNWTCP